MHKRKAILEVLKKLMSNMDRKIARGLGDSKEAGKEAMEGLAEAKADTKEKPADHEGDTEALLAAKKKDRSHGKFKPKAGAALMVGVSKPKPPPPNFGGKGKKFA